MTIFSWQAKQWQQLLRSKQNGRLTHALLLTGIAGIGKAHFADQLTRMLLCQAITEDGAHCNSCHACRLIEGKTHPNVLWVEPEKEGQVIKIDQIRDVSEFINQSSLQGEYRMAVINPANDLNANAANALLKTLEEPSQGAIIILVCDQLAQLPATILSRCQRIVFPRPPKEEALHWLKAEINDSTIDAELLLNLAHGAPLAALKLVQENILSLRKDLFQDLYLLKQKQADPIKSAAKMQDIDSLCFIDFLLCWLMDLLRLQLGANINELINGDYAKQLIELKQSTQLANNTKLMEHLQQLRGQIMRGINLNKQLLIESVLIRWMET